MEEHFWDTVNLPKSEEIKSFTQKLRKIYIDLEPQSQIDEENQRKEAMLMQTEKKRDEEQMKERQDS